MVVVALGEPGVPVVWTCAMAEGATAIKAAAKIPLRRISVFVFMGLLCVVLEKILMDVTGDFAGFIESQLWASCVERDIGLEVLRRAPTRLSASLLARGWKDSLPIVLHADHGPAVLLRLGHERITDTQHSFLLLDLGPTGIANRDV